MMMMDPRLNVIEKRLASVKKVIAVSGGKGGTGKSLVAALLALNLSKRGLAAGLFDMDFCSPTSHVILGARELFPKENKGILPPEVNGLKFMSIVFFTGTNPTPLRGNDISNAIIEILAITRWEALDYLIIDLPPGLGDAILDTLRLIKRAEFILLTVPSMLAIEVTKKEIKTLKELNIPIIGVIENMRNIKRGESPAVGQEAKNQGVTFLGSIDFDQNLEESLGNPVKIMGTNFARQLSAIVDKII